VKLNQLAFGEFRLDTFEQALWKDHQRLALRPKSLAVLHYLARNAGRLVTKTELLDAGWGDIHVGDAVLKTCISQIN